MLRFVADDAGYIAWLAAHPDGYVLNTYAHVTSAYLILHRASCRTVNRPLAKGRSWTLQYGKTCSDDRADVEEWALRETGKSVEPCGLCLAAAPGRRVGSVRQPGTQGPPHGPRAPRALVRDIDFDGEPIRVVIGPRARSSSAPPRLVIEGAQWLAETFFRRDPSAVGPRSYDSWTEETQGDPERRDRIVDADVTAINRTMAARTPHKKWASIVDSSDWTWLEAISPDWDLLEMSAERWQSEQVPDRLRQAFAAIQRPGLGIAVTTKVLYIKRPRLIPVLDSLVLAQVGARATKNVSSWVAALEGVRATGQANHAALLAIREHLRAKGVADRSLARILDALLWAGSPGSGLYPSLTGWERIMRRHVADTD